MPVLDFDPAKRHIRTPRLLLRPLEASDAGGLLGIYSQPQVTEHYELDTLADLGQAQRVLDFFLQHHDRFAMIEPSSQRMIGTCGLFFWDRTTNMASFGYDMCHEYWGRGLMREAAAAVLGHGFACKKLNRVNALTAMDNQRSMGVLRALGFEQEAVLRQFAFWKDAYHDMRMFALLREQIGPGPVDEAIRAFGGSGSDCGSG